MKDNIIGVLFILAVLWILPFHIIGRILYFVIGIPICGITGGFIKAKRIVKENALEV